MMSNSVVLIQPAAPSPPPPTDGQLLRQYVEDSSQNAFAQLVRRHTGFVYAAARRQSPHQAEDVMQAVFILLAQKAKSLLGKQQITGWLFQAVRNVASNARRTEQRRLKHERAA